MILLAENIKKSFVQAGAKGDDGTLEILRGVSLAIESAEKVAIMGRSGCGKSTFISLMAGLDRPTAGAVKILDQDLAALADRALNVFRARHIGIIFQQFHLLDHLTAFENARLPLDLNRIDNPDDRAREMLNKVGLQQRLGHYPGQLSRGECQRVAIARVLVMKPEILLADEPTGSLDVATGREVVDLIFRLADEARLALVMATHDPNVAGRADRLLYMDAGRLSAERPPLFG